MRLEKIMHGDCLEELKNLDDNSVDAIVTDPPYGLSFMGKKWDYDVPSEEIWKECLRVLKHGGYLLAFAGTRTQHRMAVRIEDAGFEIRDMIAWIYGSGFPKSLNIGKAVDALQGNEREVVGEIRAGSTAMGQNSGWNEHENKTVMDLTKGNSEWEGWGTALKPALEPITMARKPLSEKTVALNVLKWGTGGIDIDGSRVEFGEKVGRELSTNTIQKTSGISFQGNKTDTQQTPLYDFDKGRFPANFIHDGSDEVVDMFPNTKSGKANIGDGSGKNVSNGIYGKKPSVITSNFADSGSASRFFYCAKASKSERNAGCEDLLDKEIGRNQSSLDGGKMLTGSGNERSNTKKNFHPTVKPIALMEYLVKLVSKEGAIILDPFAGSGSTGVACKNTNRDYILIEREDDYIPIINARLKNAKPKTKPLTLF